MLSLTHLRCLEIRDLRWSCSFLQNTFHHKNNIWSSVCWIVLIFAPRVSEFHYLYSRKLEKIPDVSRWSNNSRNVALSFLSESVLACFMYSFVFHLDSFGLFWDHRDVDHEIFLMDNSNKNLFKDSIATELSCATNVTHRKEMGREFCV